MGTRLGFGFKQTKLWITKMNPLQWKAGADLGGKERKFTG